MALEIATREALEGLQLAPHWSVAPRWTPALLEAAPAPVIADANFPSVSVSQRGPRYIGAENALLPDLVRAIVQLLPLEPPYCVMAKVSGHEGVDTSLWQTYSDIVCPNFPDKLTRPPLKVERFQFYERAKKAFAVVHSGDTTLYGNIILVKGIL